MLHHSAVLMIVGCDMKVLGLRVLGHGNRNSLGWCGPKRAHACMSLREAARFRVLGFRAEEVLQCCCGSFKATTDDLGQA